MLTPRPLTASLLLPALLVPVLLALSPLPLSADRQVKRSRPPARWDSHTERLFQTDPLEMLEGPRPAGGPTPSGNTDGPGSPPAPNHRPPGTFAWSDVVSAAAITNEIKDLKLDVAENVRSPAVFKAGGNRKLRRHYSVIAVMFGMAAEFDQDVRWKELAPAARDSFARAARNAKAADTNTFRECKDRSEDLDELIRGGSVEFDPPQEKVLWSDVSERRPLMDRLKVAHETRLKPWTASQGEFEKNLPQIRHEAEILAALAEVIKHAEYEFYDDDVYVEYCTDMQQQAAAISQAAKDKNLDEAQRAVGEISKVCSECHEGYR
ncbi:MAG: cytochrome c [Planctomycetales bacterium]|nr:cytochrome c [Planctomycetales bacterium]NIM08926.1 cytochrome c [Planctomycetales bacterium]NIN08396.1 cytochrome c [Planctomycetales bacterium]NIN77524.1 cytochrome c [Planctomycetales bacterium]NIO34696.1 cytochrome c [Planctomycetales bacterium]